MAATIEPTTRDAGDEQLAIDIPTGARQPKTRLITRAEIHPDPEQPRKHADTELRNSIARNGMLLPITVRPHPEILGEWMIVDGERRWRSCEGVLEDLVCIVRQDQDEVARRLATQLEANTGKPLTPLEEVRAFKRILDATGMSVTVLAEFTGRPKSTVAERVGLLELGPWLPAIEAGAVPMSHVVRVLLPLRGLDDELHAKVVAEMYDGDFSTDGHDPQSVDDFRRQVTQLYKPFLYPLTKSKEYSARNPEFNTSKHDTECGCGGVKVAIGYERERVYCGNPEWWRPLDRAARKAKKAREEKKAGGATSSDGGKTLYLPEGTKTLKSPMYGSVPDGVTQLTDREGEWHVNRYGSERPFDPADLEIDPAKLVTWQAYGRDFPCVGTRDTAAVKRAREKWDARWSAERVKLLGKLGEALEPHLAEHRVEGAGVAEIAALFDVPAVEIALDVAEALGWNLPDAVTSGSRYTREQGARKWLAALTPESAANLLTGIATFVALKLKLPSERIEQLQSSALGNIKKRTIPWKTKPKAAAPAKGKAATNAESAPRRRGVAEFMRPMQPSPALAAIVGSEPLPRTEVTKKLWAYIKRQALQGEGKRRRMITADDALRPIFDKGELSMFEMTKAVNKHLTPAPKAKAAKKAKRSDRQVPLGTLSTETAEMFDEEKDDDGDGELAGDPGVGGDDDQSLWDDDEELQEAIS